MIAVRNVNQSDITSLSELAKLCFIDTFGHLYSKDNLFKHLEKTCSPDFFSTALLNDQLLVAENDMLVGYIKFGNVGLPIENIPDASKEIHRLYIHPEFQGNNIGHSLIQSALDSPDLRSAKHLYLSVYEDNKKAQKFYQDCGFSIIDEYDYHVGSHIDREFIMYKKASEI